MGNYFGRSGRKLTRAIWAVSCLTGMVFGYNQAVAGGVLTTRSFQQQFPQIDTVNVKGAEQQHRATIQGTFLARQGWSRASGAKQVVRYCRCALHIMRFLWRYGVHIFRRQMGPEKGHLLRFGDSASRGYIDGNVIRTRPIYRLSDCVGPRHG